MLDPWCACPMRTVKAAEEVTELHLSDRRGDTISSDITRFRNLEALWLSRNRLTSLETLHALFRLKELYIQGNKLSSLEGVAHMKHLKVSYEAPSLLIGLLNMLA